MQYRSYQEARRTAQQAAIAAAALPAGPRREQAQEDAREALRVYFQIGGRALVERREWPKKHVKTGRLFGEA